MAAPSSLEATSAYDAVAVVIDNGSGAQSTLLIVMMRISRRRF
jgi:hypothetical protein